MSIALIISAINQVETQKELITINKALIVRIKQIDRIKSQEFRIGQNVKVRDNKRMKVYTGEVISIGRTGRVKIKTGPHSTFTCGSAYLLANLITE